MIAIFKLIAVLVLISPSIQAAQKYNFFPGTGCSVYESAAGGKWSKVDSSILTESPVVVTDSPKQSNYYYVKKNGKWLMAPKSCFTGTSGTKDSSHSSESVTSSLSKKWAAHVSILGWQEQIGILSSASTLENKVNTSQFGTMLGISRSLMDSIISLSATAGFVFAIGSTTSASSSITYTTTGNYILGGLFGLTASMKPSSFYGFRFGAEPFVLIRKGDWSPPTSTTRTYTMVDAIATRMGLLLEAKKYVSKTWYFAPEVGFLMDGDVNLIWALQIGMAF